MMVVLTEQIEALTRAQFNRYEHRVRSFLRANPGERDPALLTDGVVRKLIAEAREAGVNSERNLALYAAGVWQHGDDFLAAVEPLRDQFQNDKIAPKVKARLLRDEYDKLGK